MITNPLLNLWRISMRGSSKWLMISVIIACTTALPARSGQNAPAPTTETIALSQLHQPVEILVDHWGVPHIYAKNEADLFFAQGFIVARDRLFQIDLWRRRGLGQLAEVFGPAYVEQDKATRLFLYRGDMKKEWGVYGPGTQEMFQQWTAGINAYVDWLAQHPDQMPFEFKYLHYKPAYWNAEDAIRIRSYAYAYNLAEEVARAKVACVADLMSDELRFKLQPPWHTVIPDGLDPCLPNDVLKIYALATQPVRFHVPPGLLQYVMARRRQSDGVGSLPSRHEPERSVGREPQQLLQPGSCDFLRDRGTRRCHRVERRLVPADGEQIGAGSRIERAPDDETEEARTGGRHEPWFRGGGKLRDNRGCGCTARRHGVTAERGA
jgi:hypothetical protein